MFSLFNCVETTCDGNVKLTRDDSVCTPVCTCEYTRSCDTSECGGCDLDDDCPGTQVCNLNSCGCVDYVAGAEYSIHIYEIDCSYRFCVSGDRDNSLPNITIGTISTTTSFSLWGTENYEVNDIITINDDENILSFESNVLNSEDCIIFDTDGAVTYDFTQGSQVPSLNKIYFEPGDENPTEIPFEYSTPMSNDCRECIETENPEVTLDDGIDNDCDDLIDEPPFRDEYGVYIWDANCDYYLCAHAKDGVDHTTKGEISVEDGYELYNVDDIDWESNDDYTQNLNKDKLTFTSLIYNDEDCLVFNADTLVKYDLDLNGSKDTDNIFLTQRTFNPYTNPFRYANPDCSLTCTGPDDCGIDSISYGTLDCGYEDCIFDCGGYWVNESSTTSGNSFILSTFLYFFLML